MKICCRCKIEKPLTEFHKDKTQKDGLQTKCRICNAAAVASHRAANLDWDKARKAKYHVENREKNNTRRDNHRAANKDADSAYQRRYRLENIDKIISYRSANSEKIAERMREWRKENHEKCSANNRNRRARERSAEGTHTAVDIRAIFEKQQGLCSNCQTKLFKSGVKKYHVDHIMPLKLGGSNWPSNLQCLCPPCNLKKNAKDPVKWANENGRLI